MSQEIMAILNDPSWQKEKAEFDKRFEQHQLAIAPFISEARWHLLEFTEDARKVMAGDPDIAFQCEIGGWVIRMDYSGEIGNSASWWKKGHEAECLTEWDLFAHGKVLRLANDAEHSKYGWAFEEAIGDWFDFAGVR